jgi:transcriptional regulator with XRE-family HTH domain
MPPNRQREDPGVSLIPSWCEELRAARLARDWSEDDLADQIQNWEYRHGAGRSLGVSRSYVSEWETGKRGVSRDYAIRIEGVTGIPRDHFIDHRSTRGRVVRLQEAEVGLHWTDDLEDALASVFREVRGGCPPSYARSPLSRENAAV